MKRLRASATVTSAVRLSAVCWPAAAPGAAAMSVTRSDRIIKRTRRSDICHESTKSRNYERDEVQISCVGLCGVGALCVDRRRAPCRSTTCAGACPGKCSASLSGSRFSDVLCRVCRVPTMPRDRIHLLASNVARPDDEADRGSPRPRRLWRGSPGTPRRLRPLVLDGEARRPLLHFDLARRASRGKIRGALHPGRETLSRISLEASRRPNLRPADLLACRIETLARLEGNYAGSRQLRSRSPANLERDMRQLPRDEPR